MRMNKPPRRFPPPWSVQKTEGSHFKISDANGFALAYVYVKDNRAGGYDGLTEDEARRIAAKHRAAAGAAAAEELRTEQQEAAPAQGATTGAAERAPKSLTRRHKRAPLCLTNR